MTIDRDMEDTVVEGSGDVFKDLGLSMSNDDMLKINIARAISNKIQLRKLTQARAAELMKIDQPKVSKVVRGLLKDFSVEWLMERYICLGYDIEIRLPDEKAGPVGKIRMVAA